MLKPDRNPVSLPVACNERTRKSAPVAPAVGLLHMMGLRGSRVVMLKIRRGPFDVRQMESEIQPGLARVREDVRRPRVRLARSGAGRR